MRWSWILFALLACQPRGPQGTSTKTDETDADTDADSDSDADSDADTDTTVTGTNCADGPATTGPWDDHPITVAGATATPSAYTFDAGVGAVIAATAGQTDPTAVSLVVDGAILTARDYVPTVNDGTVSFWFEDASGPMFAYRVPVPVDPTTLAPGDELSFTVTEVQDYFGTLEVTALEDFQVLSSGNPVHVVDVMADGPITWADHGSYVVEVYGGLVAGPTDCGANCFDLDYGGNIVTFRTGSSYDVVGDCIHYIGPVTQFSGVEQLDAGDYDWYTYY